MLLFKGKYNFANVMIDALDEETVKQLYSFLNHPAFANTYIAIMPDAHAGKGSCIGFTMKMNEYVIPNVIGVDIGCSVSAYTIGDKILTNEIFADLDKFIITNIPYGTNIRDKAYKYDSYRKNTTYIELIEKVEEICSRCRFDFNYMKNSLGTLGGGNHFIELNVDDQGVVWLSVHTGSRKFGKEVAEYHQNKAKDLMKKMFIGDAYSSTGLQFLPLDQGGESYLKDMKVAQEFAQMNHHMIAESILEDFFRIDKKNCNSIMSIHNYINFDDNIIRKGAISAHKDEMVLIPLNQSDGVIIGKGKGAKSWNYSAPHGAGRVLSRKKAKEVITVDNVIEDMKGIWTSCISKKNVDESKRAYKDSEIIINAIGEAVDIITVMKPVYNFKDGRDSEDE